METLLTILICIIPWLPIALFVYYLNKIDSDMDKRMDDVFNKNKNQTDDED